MKKTLFALVLGCLVAAPTIAHSQVNGQLQASARVTAGETILRGTGARVVSVYVPRNSPLVVTGTHSGQSNFIVHMVKSGNKEFIFNEIGRYNGQALVAEPAAGRYRVAVDADGAWTLKFTQPRPISGPHHWFRVSSLGEAPV